ncbi:MAG: hypothetical protein U9O89_03960 [Thermoproteota archaeon]|nr:hypothetical protein [Thermoproteota archaeon]
MYEAKGKSIIGLFLSLVLVFMLGVGLGLGIGLYHTLSTFKAGYWKGTVEDSNIVILTITHRILREDEIATVIDLKNNGDATVDCNCTLYYRNSSGDLATHSFNTTIDAGNTHREAFVIQPLDITQWSGTDVSIFEYE